MADEGVLMETSSIVRSDSGRSSNPLTLISTMLDMSVLVEGGVLGSRKEWLIEREVEGL